MEAYLDAVGAEAAAALRARAGRRRFARGDALMHAGQVPTDVLLLERGRVKIWAGTPSGTRVLLAIRGPGELVGELSALDARPRSASVEALEPGEALVIAHDSFRSLVAGHPAAALALLDVLSARLREADGKRLRLASQTTMARVAFSLLELCDRFAATELPISQEELAGWTGASLESVARALRAMRELGWIETRRRAIAVLDRDALSRAAA